MLIIFVTFVYMDAKLRRIIKQDKANEYRKRYQERNKYNTHHIYLRYIRSARERDIKSSIYLKMSSLVS